MAIKAYNSPGVVVQETVNPSLAPLLANPSIVAIVGAARGYQSATERLVLTQSLTTTAGGSQVFPLTTLNVTSTAGFDSSGTLEIGTQLSSTVPVTATYTGKTATSFTGVSGGSGTWANGTEVRQQNRQLLKYTGVTSSTATVKSSVDGSSYNLGTYLLSQGTDPDATVTGDEPWYLSRQQAPDSASTTVVGSATGLTGTYAYKVSFINATGETGPGPATSDLAVTNQKIDISNIPLGPPGTTSRVIYRRKTTASGGDGLFHVAATIANNTATTLTGENAVDGTVQAAAQPVNGLASGDTVVLAYNFVDNNYYEPTLIDTMGDAVDKYGAEVDSNGNINSPLMYAARLAMLNGASELMLVAAASDSDSAIDAALAQLEDEPDVRIVVAARGTATSNTSVKAHVDKMNGQGYYRIGIVGRDGSVTTVDSATLRAAAKAFNSESLAMVSPSSFVVENSVTGGNLSIGAQYAAAAIAGMLAARDVQIPVTRKNVAGFQGYNDKRTLSDLAIDSASGLMVIQNQGGILTVRHGISTNVGSVNARELSVVRAKYDMAHRLKDSLDSSVVGVVLPLGRAPGVVQAAVVGILEQLTVEGTIDSYNAVQARLLQGDPTTVEVRFEYTPAYPINNVVVIFTINTNTGEFTLV